LADHFNELTNEEQERLSMLLEECGEVLQVIGKIQRFGFDNSHSKYGDKTFRELLAMEIGDVLIAISMLLDNGDIENSLIDEFQTKKRNKINNALRYNKV
jgi:NTP pyrophosphatase (non-canonical NTP hydrolase)